MHDLSCVVHLHSTYSDGTGTVREIARAAARAKADVVLLTDHDSLEARRRGEEGWYGDVLLLAGDEVSPLGRDHYLAFGIDNEIRHRGLDACAIACAVREAGGFGFAAHPFSEGSRRFKRPGMPFDALDCDALHGVELWNFANDTGEQIDGILPLIRFLAMPARVLDHPPERNMRRWDELCRERPVVAIGGLDAHQFGKRIGPVVPVRVMAYHRSFRLIRTHVLCDREPARELERDRELVFDALRAGRCYIAVNSVAPAHGFRFEAADVPMGGEAPAGRRTLHVRTPLPARLRVLRDGHELASAEGTMLDADVDEPGAYRAEARRVARGRERTWIISNPVYLR
ncbi:MAG TPA: CehA/McbA family metallohydrolase [Thermoleophilaceae bacterium]|nr:CehA/McbA family metallohydrolase [Thermoleophilaceae bacterium]